MEHIPSLSLSTHISTMKTESVSRSVMLDSFATPWTVAHQGPPSFEFSRQEYWGVGYHFLLQGIFPTQGSNPGLLHWQADSLPSEPPGKPLFQGAVVKQNLKLLCFLLSLLVSLPFALTLASLGLYYHPHPLEKYLHTSFAAGCFLGHLDKPCPSKPAPLSTTVRSCTLGYKLRLPSLTWV